MSSAGYTGNSEPIVETCLNQNREPEDLKAVPDFSNGTAFKSNRLVLKCAVLRTKIHAVYADSPVESWFPIQFRIDSVYHR